MGAHTTRWYRCRLHAAHQRRSRRPATLRGVAPPPRRSWPALRRATSSTVRPRQHRVKSILDSRASAAPMESRMRRFTCASLRLETPVYPHPETAPSATLRRRAGVMANLLLDKREANLDRPLECFELPLAITDRHRAISRLEAGAALKVGDVSLHPDPELELVWGVDPYGVDCIAAGAIAGGQLDFARALTWAEQQNAAQARPHPAEYAW